MTLFLFRIFSFFLSPGQVLKSENDHKLIVSHLVGYSSGFNSFSEIFGGDWKA